MSQQALILNEIGRPLVLTSRPIPKPKPNEILVKILSIGLNPHDQKIRDYGAIISADSLPYVPANDIAGTVKKVGSDVTSFNPGDRVFAQADTSTVDGGGLQQYAVISADLVGKIPPSVADDEAATIPTVAMAAFVALSHESGLGLSPFDKTAWPDYKSQILLIIGGGSNSGKMAIQLARMIGFGKIVAIASKTPEKEAKLKQLGATTVVDRHAEDLAKETRAAVGDDVVYALDTVHGGDGSHTFGASMLSSHKKGAMATLLPGSVDEAELKDKGAGYNVRFTIGSGHFHRELGRQFWQHVPEWIESGAISSLPYRTISGLKEDEVNEALDIYRQGGETTKVLVHPQSS